VFKDERRSHHNRRAAAALTSAASPGRQEAFMFDGMPGGSRDDRECSGRHGDAVEPVRLGRLFPDARFIACDDIAAHGCHDDPAQCGQGDVFVARLTAHGDGHDDVAQAIARGVAGIVAERIIPTFGTPLCLVDDSAWALARLSHALAGDPARSLRVIAITGTSGKTTTAWLAASVLSEAGLRVGVLSDLGCLDADATTPIRADLERPAVLADWLGRLAASGCTHAVVEVSSRMLAEQSLAGIECDTVVVSNLAAAHLDLHGTVTAYHALKARVLDHLADDGVLVGCRDDDRVRRLLDRHARRKRGTASIAVGLTAEADLTAVPVDRGLFGQTFLMQAGGHSMPVAVTTPVASFVRDALLAAAVGLRYGVPLERIGRGLEAAGSVSGRLERIDRGQDFPVFLDHPTSGHSLATTLAGLRRLTTGRLVLVSEERLAAALGDEAAGRSSRFRTRAARWCDECLIVPGGMLADDAGAAALAAYARIDRLFSSLGGDDCLLVIGDMPPQTEGPCDPTADATPLARIVEGWLQLAHGTAPARSGRRRRAA
jgi:UDP-N-acetylmuramoyl-L-alanyl-D-glutamate--2,6-diaminopimelate ligase